MRIIFLSFLFCLSFKIYSQDTIYFVNSNKVVAKIIDINAFNVIYKPIDSTAKQRTILVPKKQVRLIAYSNGSFIICSVKKINPGSLQSYPMFLKGTEDAAKHYKHPGGSVATGITSFLTGGILGLIPAIACSSTQPKLLNLDLPKDAPVNNRDYMLGYLSKAKKMKQTKVWTCYGMGLAAVLAVVLVTGGIN